MGFLIPEGYAPRGPVTAKRGVAAAAREQAALRLVYRDEMHRDPKKRVRLELQNPSYMGV